MRSAIATLVAIAALLAALPAAADDTSYVGDYYRLAGADDGSSTLYMVKDYTHAPNERGWILLAFVVIKAGPGVSDGVFAQYRTNFINCTDQTMGVFSYTDYDRLAEVSDSNTDAQEDDVEFQPINMGSQYGLVYQIVCNNYDTGALTGTGNVSLLQLINSSVAAYDARAGQPYAY